MRQSLVCVSFRGERAVHHDHNKNISKGHRHPPRLWDVKARPFEAQNWHHNPTRSFHHRAGTNNGYVTGPGDRYANWDHSVSNSVVRRSTDLETVSVFSECAVVFFGHEQTFSLDWQHGGPRPHRNNRELQSPTDRLAPSECHRSFPGRMINNRAGPWKRPALHQRRDQLHQHSPPPTHSSSPREECPAKRRRDSGPDQVEFDSLEQQTLIYIQMWPVNPHLMLTWNAKWNISQIYFYLFNVSFWERAHTRGNIRHASPPCGEPQCVTVFN